MRITDISLYSGSPQEAIEMLSFSLQPGDPGSKYIARSIVGLDAEEIVPRFYGVGLVTKPKYYDFKLKPRDIVIRVVLNPRFSIDESYSDIRDDLYRAISSSRTGQVVLHFHAEGTLVSRIFGFITKFEVSYFTQSPEVQFTVKCNDPMFRAINPVSYKPAELKTTNPVVIGDNISTAPHGFSMRLTFKATSTSFTVQDAAVPEWTFKITPSGGFAIGDILYFSSDYVDKYLYMIRSGVTTYLIDRLELNSIWPVIFPGTNNLHFVDIAKFDWNAFEFYPAYWGV
jgi:hypothetical protein